MNTYFSDNNMERDEAENKIYKLICDDIKRTHPQSELFRDQRIQELLVRVLFIWNMRHPACGYV
jgi:hypothetical protein